MEHITVETPKDAQWCRIITEVPVNARSGYDYKGSCDMLAEWTRGPSFHQPGISGTMGFLPTGISVPMPPGIVLLSQQEHRSLTEVRTTFSILLPDGMWYAANSITGVESWAYLLRTKIRSWLSLSAEARILRAIYEMAAKLDSEFRKRMRDNFEQEIDETSVALLNQITSLERMAVNISLSPGEASITTELMVAFEKWLEAMAATIGKDPDEIKLLLMQGLNGKSSDSDDAKTFGRAMRFS
jgi:hypothetical protein